MIDCNLALVMIRNNSNKSRKLTEKSLLRFMTELEEPEVYTAHDNIAKLTYELIKEPAMVSRPEDLT